jgi:putative membrane protein
MGLPVVRLGLSIAVFLALSGCATGTFWSTMPGLTSPARPPVSVDQDFLNRAATGTWGEVALGQLALEHGSAPTVRRFGAHIAYEHRRVHASLIALAHRLHMSAKPGSFDTNWLESLSGAEFDREFIADQVNDQREALGLFEREAEHGHSHQLRRFARERLPFMRRDLRRAEILAVRLHV